MNFAGTDGNSKIYFAVGKDVDGSCRNLSWVARNFPGKTICFLYVLHPSRPTPSGYACHDIDNKLSQKIVNKYLLMWKEIGFEGDEVYIEMERVEEGIVKLISELRIENLVMEVAARDMVNIKSAITEYVIKNGDPSCQIWFLLKGHLIETRYEQVIIESSCGSKKEIYKELMCETETESIEAACKLEGNVNDELCKNMEQSMRNANKSKIEAFEESPKLQNAEKDALEAVPRAKAAEKMYTDEMNLRKEIEDALLLHKLELEIMSDQLVAVMKERNSALWEKSLLEIKISNLERNAENLQEKLISAVELLQSYKNQRDNLQVERDRALIANEQLSLQAAISRVIGYLPPLIPEVSYSDIKEATQGFHPSFKVGEEGSHYYKGLLRGTEVAMKILYGDCSQGSSEYQQEVEVLSRLRHPNIVSLIGACPEAYAIVHEYLPNGSLEDRLSCKGNSAPLSWQARFRIATELCSALIYLHSTKPHPIVHGDLKPSNIFLDANFVSKLCNFGTCHVISPDPVKNAWSAGPRRILPKGTFAYLDPEFRTAVERKPSAQLDIYSFGIILLKLLTGKEAWGIVDEVQRAVHKGELNPLLDSSAGDWPYIQTRQLTYIALRCADASRKNRPNLESEVLKVLEAIRASCLGISSSPRPGVDRNSQAPSYYTCPISQDIMQDPHVAADGFTYELEGIRGWLLSGHNTSPMTNLKLAHTKLVPNRALRSAIQEWLNHD